MSTVTVTTGLDRAARLIPFRTAGASRLTGEYGAVLSPAETMPEQFRQGQRDRTAYYLAPANGWEQGFRCKPDHAVRYYVTSYGVPIAWVTLDGRTHFADDSAMARGLGFATYHTADAMRRHREAIRASWPERFAINGEGDPITISEDGGRSYRFAPAGSRQTCDRKGWVHVVLPDGACNICEGAHTDDAPAAV
jgi:hypothetical protein